MGKASSSGTTAALRSSYTRLKLVMLAGICGGVPGSSELPGEMILGDVVISRCVIQFDLGRRYADRFSRKDTIYDNLGRSNLDVRSLLAIYESEFGRSRLQRGCTKVLDQIQHKAIEDHRQTCYDRPAASEDTLFESSNLHIHPDWNDRGCGCSNSGSCATATSTSCQALGCNQELTLPRNRLGDGLQLPRIFIGNVGSGDTVMKSSEHLDRLAKEHDIIAFEMEGAGLWDQMPCIIVKGVCDYADSHKNKTWQPYAALTAASVTKALLNRYVREDRPHASEASFTTKGPAQHFANTSNGTQNNNSGSGRQYVSHTMTVITSLD